MAAAGGCLGRVKYGPAFLIALWLAVQPVTAQSLPLDRLTPALPTAGERTAADWASWGTVLTAVALDTRTSWKAEDRVRAFELEGARVGITYGAVLLVKVLAHRTRPCAPSCGTDNPQTSFYSAHTALAFSTVGGSPFALTLGVTTGGLRVAAGKHWLTDVLTGALAGWATSRVR